jgi:alkanesulfonate monooxygenase SsuD/methylene tetrahydromethanopterin reductase-like flavin-dependent oxidoreductase (luciferase family)
MDRMIIRENRRRMIVGDPEKVRSELLRFSEEYGVHEILVNTMIHDFRDRLRSYELLAEMFLRQEGGGSRLDR